MGFLSPALKLLGIAPSPAPAPAPAATLHRRQVRLLVRATPAAARERNRTLRLRERPRSPSPSPASADVNTANAPLVPPVPSDFPFPVIPTPQQPPPSLPGSSVQSAPELPQVSQINPFNQTNQPNQTDQPNQNNQNRRSQPRTKTKKPRLIPVPPNNSSNSKFPRPAPFRPKRRVDDNQAYPLVHTAKRVRWNPSDASQSTSHPYYSFAPQAPQSAPMDAFTSPFNHPLFPPVNQIRGPLGPCHKLKLNYELFNPTTNKRKISDSLSTDDPETNPIDPASASSNVASRQIARPNPPPARRLPPSSREYETSLDIEFKYPPIDDLADYFFYTEAAFEEPGFKFRQYDMNGPKITLNEYRARQAKLKNHSSGTLPAPGHSVSAPLQKPEDTQEQAQAKTQEKSPVNLQEKVQDHKDTSVAPDASQEDTLQEMLTAPADPVPTPHQVEDATVTEIMDFLQSMKGFVLTNTHIQHCQSIIDKNKQKADNTVKVEDTAADKAIDKKSGTKVTGLCGTVEGTVKSNANLSITSCTKKYAHSFTPLIYKHEHALLAKYQPDLYGKPSKSNAPHVESTPTSDRDLGNSCSNPVTEDVPEEEFVRPRDKMKTLPKELKEHWRREFLKIEKENEEFMEQQRIKDAKSRRKFKPNDEDGKRFPSSTRLGFDQTDANVAGVGSSNDHGVSNFVSNLPGVQQTLFEPPEIPLKSYVRGDTDIFPIQAQQAHTPAIQTGSASLVTSATTSAATGNTAVSASLDNQPSANANKRPLSVAAQTILSAIEEVEGPPNSFFDARLTAPPTVHNPYLFDLTVERMLGPKPPVAPSPLAPPPSHAPQEQSAPMLPPQLFAMTQPSSTQQPFAPMLPPQPATMTQPPSIHQPFAPVLPPQPPAMTQMPAIQQPFAPFAPPLPQPPVSDDRTFSNSVAPAGTQSHIAPPSNAFGGKVDATKHIAEPSLLSSIPKAFAFAAPESTRAPSPNRPAILATTTTPFSFSAPASGPPPQQTSTHNSVNNMESSSAPSDGASESTELSKEPVFKLYLTPAPELPPSLLALSRTPDWEQARRAVLDLPVESLPVFEFDLTPAPELPPSLLALSRTPAWEQARKAVIDFPVESLPTFEF